MNEAGADATEIPPPGDEAREPDDAALVFEAMRRQLAR